ncbi:Helix-turn-helix domain-containing protein [Cohnella sp. OV330]|uniref:helix-turn-helix domain-containing protein n=1 Tax=Cohnella sp. OV330 TaxID=1855288 RepID=UPI0008EA08A3|nr:helix-turn-helix domain-containing protein [Cohnella sp. OV330]SFA98150.1 Helix-turn-helix domain-containing protein [Cohnella sp. OV330]
MLRVMVVDDEAPGRKAIVKLIEQLELPVEVVAEAKNGEEALDLIRMNKPHIVVTDMFMPIMNGQLFLERLHRDYEEIKAIVISGYSQFDYLKAALKYQACEYVLKPVALSELREAMNKAIRAVNEFSDRQLERKSSLDMAKLRTEVFLQHVAERRIANAADIRRQARELGLPAESAGYRVAVCRIRQFQGISASQFRGNADLYMFGLENVMREVLRDEGTLLFKTDDRSRLCLILPCSSYPDLRAGEALGAFQQAVAQTLGGDVAVGLSSAFAGLEELPDAFQAALSALSRCEFAYTGLTISPADKAPAAPAELLSSFDLRRLSHAFGAGNARDAGLTLDEFARKIASRPSTTIGDVQRELARLAELAKASMPGMPAKHAPLFEATAIGGVMEAGGLQSYLNGVTLAAEAYAESRRDAPESVRTVQDIVRYLDEHYFEDVGLIDVATRYHIDPSYLSKLFKTVTQENFIEYVTRKRMEKACELLASPERKINEIAELVGYENQRYFSQVFKKHTSQTPSEYRESLGHA